ncbi:MAG: hypothetical protein OEY49_10015 [Candidatus Heimdallarchaeota archaeon]|nr:hypothetical protein [Candidatus Heimdallarchaeota archaeon]
MPRGISTKRGKNKGMKYEEKIAESLKKFNLICDNYESAGGSEKPDQYIRINNKCYYIEIKQSKSADYGQIAIKYSLEKEQWYITKDNANLDKQSKINLIEEANFLEKINNLWNETPKRFTVDRNEFTEADMNFDYDYFSKGGEVWGDYSISLICDYYNAIDVYYIQIKGLGLFYMGQNPANLEIPALDGITKLRARIKRANSRHIKNYNFFIALKFQVEKSLRSKLSLDNENFLLQLSNSK